MARSDSALRVSACAARRGAPPEQPAQKGRCELRDGRKRQEPDRGERARIAGGEVIGVGERQHRRDGDPADVEHEARAVAARPLRACVAPQHQGQDEVVRHHDGERHAGHDHHGGGGRQPAQEHQRGKPGRVCGERQGQHEQVRVELRAEGGEAEQRHRRHEQVDRHEVERKQPARGGELAGRSVLHHRHVELARQKQKGEVGQRGEHEEARRVRAGGERDEGVQRQGIARPGHEHHPGAQRKKRHELHERFRGDREHEAVLVLRGVGVAGAEQDGEQHQRQRHHRRRGGRAEARTAREPAQTVGFQGDHGGGDRLELQRQVGHRRHERDHRRERAYGARLAVARGEEVGDRGDALGLGHRHDAREEPVAEGDGQDRPQVDAEEVEPRGRREPDGAEERPRRAVDRERQGVDQWPPAALPFSTGPPFETGGRAAGAPVAGKGHKEQEGDVTHRDAERDPSLHEPPWRRAASASHPAALTMNGQTGGRASTFRQRC